MIRRTSACWLVALVALVSSSACRAAPGSDEPPGVTPLMLAARDGERDKVVRLIAGGADPEQVDEEGWNAIIYAAARSRAQIVALLLERGALVDHATLQQITPLMQVATAPDTGLPTVQVLVDGGADVNLKSSSGKTALHFAALYGNAGATRLLLAAGADTDAVDEDGWSPLMLAARRGQGRAAELLLEAGADANRSSRLGWTALTDCAARGRYKMVARLLAAGAQADLPDSAGRSPLWWAAQYGEPKVAQLLLAAGADPNGKGAASTPLWAAAASGNEAVLQLLIAAGADIGTAHRNGLTPLMVAAREDTLGWAEQGGANWPTSLGRILAERHPECVVVNAGVWGYSSFQGLARLRQVLRVEPDLVLFSFGGNDAHSVTVPDSQYVATRDSQDAGASRLSRLRLAQLFAAVRDRLAAPERAPAATGLTHRVPLGEYRANLEQAIALAQGGGVKIVLLTRPYVGESHDPRWWKHFARDYNEATVEIGWRHEVPVVDIYSAFKDLDSYFVDESHFTARGHDDAAAIIAASLLPLLD